ncbi:MAG: SDR family NAD(P)-dependent oxidoreductase [Gemmatimonadaceae bacterium]|nr:SDR family NAD(P)-dependent oxidoreductase [Gemmatimonadaceae bacterium]
MTSHPTVLVTGGNRGIGLAIVERFARKGYPVVLGSRDADAGERAAAALRDRGFDVTALTLDVAKPSSIDTAMAELVARGVTVQVLVNNAGVLHEGTLLEVPLAHLDESIAVHLTGPLRLIRAVTPGMRSAGRGWIVNMSSGWGAFAGGMNGPGAYGVTKAALNAMTASLAHALPDAIKVNVMDPGWVRTRMGGHAATRAPSDAAETAVWLGTLPIDGPTGGFFRDRRQVPW